MYCTIEAMKLTTDRHEASHGLFATAELLVKPPLATARASLRIDVIRLSVCLSVAKMQKNAIFLKTLKQSRAMVSIDDL